MAHPLAPMANHALWGGQERKSSYAGLATRQILPGLAEKNTNHISNQHPMKVQVGKIISILQQGTL